MLPLSPRRRARGTENRPERVVQQLTLRRAGLTYSLAFQSSWLKVTSPVSDPPVATSFPVPAL